MSGLPAHENVPLTSNFSIRALGPDQPVIVSYRKSAREIIRGRDFAKPPTVKVLDATVCQEPVPGKRLPDSRPVKFYGAELSGDDLSGKHRLSSLELKNMRQRPDEILEYSGLGDLVAFLDALKPFEEAAVYDRRYVAAGTWFSTDEGLRMPYVCLREGLPAFGTLPLRFKLLDTDIVLLSGVIPVP